MKRLSKSFSQNVATILLLSLVSVAFSSCEKTDPDLVGEWRLTEMSYRITAAQDFTFNDVFGKPWQGTISINDEEFNIGSFNYYYDNTWGPTLFSSGEVAFIFFGPNLEIYLRDERYMLELYEFDVLSGIFKADGMAKGNHQSIHVKIDTTMPKITVKQGEQITVRDGYYNMPYTNIWFKNGGKLQVDYLTGDILDRLSGKWNVKTNRITLSVKNHKEDTYQYNFKSNELILYKDNISKEELPHHLSPYAGKISNVAYLATYSNM